MLSVIKLIDIMLNAIVLSVTMLCVNRLRVIILSDIVLILLY
jgi:hypothetical protein